MTIEKEKTVLQVIPENIVLSEGDSVQLSVLKTIESGESETVGNLRWKEVGGGGIIDQYGVLTAVRPGAFSYYVYIPEPDPEITGERVLTGYYNVVPIEEKIESKIASINEKFSAMEKLEPTERIENKRIQKATIKKITVEKLQERAKETTNTSGDFMRHTRAVTRTIGANKDLVWLGVLAIIAMVFGGSLILLLNGFTVERIATFLTMLIGIVISLFGKIYAPPGEVTESIEMKMAGSDDTERMKYLTEKRDRINTRIREITARMHGGPQTQKSFYKMTMDESVQ